MQANAEHLSAELPLEGEGRVLYPASAKAGAGLQVPSLTLIHQEHISVPASLSFPFGFIAASGTLGELGLCTILGTVLTCSPPSSFCDRKGWRLEALA